MVSRCCGSGSAFCVVGVDVTHMPRRQIEPNQATPAMMSLRSSGLWGVVYWLAWLGSGGCANGDGGIYQRASDGRWVGALTYVDAQGKRRRHVVYGQLRREVVAKLKEAQGDWKQTSQSKMRGPRWQPSLRIGSEVAASLGAQS